MSVTLAPSVWAAASSPAGGRSDAAPGAAAAQWVLRRNCCLTPRQVAGVYLSLCVVSCVIAAAFWWAGAPVVLAFAGLELAAVGAALLVYARHAGDRETITIDGGVVRVEHHCGRRVERAQFNAAWLRVEPADDRGALVGLTGQGRRVRVGRYTRPEWRPALAQDLRRALHGGGVTPPQAGGAESTMQTQST